PQERREGRVRRPTRHRRVARALRAPGAGRRRVAMAPHGYAQALLEALLSLGLVCILAFGLLRWLARRGGRMGAPGQGALQVLERTALDARRAVFLVRAGDRVLLLGVGDGGAPTVLQEWAADASWL